MLEFLQTWLQGHGIGALTAVLMLVFRDAIPGFVAGIQADIFDHILAVLREFDLRVYQNPSASDFRGLARAN